MTTERTGNSFWNVTEDPMGGRLHRRVLPSEIAGAFHIKDREEFIDIFSGDLEVGRS